MIYKGNREKLLDNAIDSMDEIDLGRDPTIGSVVKFVSIIEMLDFLRSGGK